MIGRRISWKMGDKPFRGTVSEIRPNGHLMVKVDNYCKKYKDEWSPYCLVIPPEHPDHLTSVWLSDRKRAKDIKYNQKSLF